MNPIDLSKSEKKIMRIVRSHGEISRSDITAHTDLTQQSVHRIVGLLIGKGLLKEDKPIIRGRGKPSPRIVINDETWVSIGFSISSDYVSMVVITPLGKELANVQLKTPANEVETVLGEAKLLFDQWKTDLLANKKILGIGVSVQGYRIGDFNKYYLPVPIANWNELDIAKVIGARFDLPALSENNANCAVYAEHHLNTEPEINTICYLSFNYGFGAGAIYKHQLIRGSFGNAGEISNLYSEQEIYHRPALGELIKRLAANGVHISNLSELRAKFDPNWPGVQDWIDEIKPFLDQAIYAYASIIDPQVIYFGGEAPQKLREMMLESSAKRARHNARYPHPELRISKVEGDAATLGAAFLPVQHFVY